MEGNGCYKFTTVANFIKDSGRPPIETILDIGMNVADEFLEMQQFLPGCCIDGYEPVNEWFDMALIKMKTWHAEGRLSMEGVRVFREAVSNIKEPLVINYGVGGGAASGGSILTTTDKQITGNSMYRPLEYRPKVVTLEKAVARMGGSVDFLKIDCEGCEHSVLGDAEPEVLRNIRFIGGEFHNVSTFWESIQHTLLMTHWVNFVGAPSNGSFVAVRKGPDADLFRAEEVPYFADPSRIRHHLFCEEYIEPGTGWWHGQDATHPTNQSIFKELVGTSPHFVGRGGSRLTFELLEENRIGEGRTGASLYWAVYLQGKQPLLVFEGHHGPSHKFLRNDQNIWVQQ